MDEHTLPPAAGSGVDIGPISARQALAYTVKIAEELKYPMFLVARRLGKEDKTIEHKLLALMQEASDANASFIARARAILGRSDMPSKSPSQARLMAAAAHDPAFAKRVGVPRKVAKEFNRADAGTGILSRRPAKRSRPKASAKTESKAARLLAQNDGRGGYAKTQARRAVVKGAMARLGLK
ncbi:MAG TPA: hypothetical protein VKB42_02775 [Dongiaceae bacterium]|nr:hypothetical protein [Dongiaceae bacterium]